MSSNHDRHGQHRYGSVHKAQRKRWARVVAAGGVACWRCRKPIPRLSNAAASGVDVDVEIVPLIELIWSRGIHTLLSCQDQDGLVWVEFPGPDAEQFVNLAAADGELAANVLGLVPIDTDDFEAYNVAAPDGTARLGL